MVDEKQDKKFTKEQMWKKGGKKISEQWIGLENSRYFEQTEEKNTPQE